MSQNSVPDFDPERDILFDGAEGKAKLVWYIDYASIDTRRIRDALVRTAERFGTANAALAARFLPERSGEEGAELAARAAIAASRQGRFRDMHRALFDTRPPYSEDSIDKIARKLDLDLGRFEDDLWSRETSERLESDRDSISGGQHLHAPILFIDGRLYDDAWDELSIIEAVEKPLGLRLRIASNDFFDWAASAGLVLVSATLLALVVANLGFHDAYEHLRETQFALSFGDARFGLSLEAWINDGLMALFFLLVGIEIKREIVAGELSDPRRAALPIVAAIGGMAAPALIYTAFNYGGPAAQGWGVPMATDIAFTLGIMALLGDRVPTSLKVFVSALAIADDLGAILVIALFYGEGFNLGSFVVAAAVFALMLALNAGRIYSRTPYLVLGAILWVFVHESGLHATLAGVLTAAAIPSRRAANVQGVAAQTAALFSREITDADEPVGEGTLRRLQNAIERLREPGYHLQNALEGWSNFLILPLFAFFNTGILVLGSGFTPVAPETMGVILGLVIGKPLGIALSVYVAVTLGIARLSSEISWTQVIGAGFLAGVGFTMSIFIASSAFSGEELEAVKLATLIASAIAATIGAGILIAAGRRAERQERQTD